MGEERNKGEEITTGDAILMSSITTFAVIVKWSTMSEFNHAAVAVRVNPDCLPKIEVQKENGLLCLIEFNGDDVKNILSGEIHHGNRLVKFDDITSKYKRIAYRKLDSKYYTDEFEEKIEGFIQKYCNHLTRMDVLNPMMGVLGLELAKTNNEEMPAFCSELAAKFYGDLIPGSVDTNYKNLLPHHFGTTKYNHLFSSDVTDFINQYHPVMDFFHSKLFWVLVIIVLIIVIILFIFGARKVYYIYCNKNNCYMKKEEE